MRSFDWQRLRAFAESGACRVLAVKEAYHEAPFAEAMIGIDLIWLARERAALTELAKRMQVVLAIRGRIAEKHFVPGAVYHERISQLSMSLTATAIDATNSGGAAIHYAALRGARDVVLFGFDYSGGHYCPDRYDSRQPSKYLAGWGRQVGAFAAVAENAGIKIFNACPHSALTGFRKGTQHEAFEYLCRLGSSSGESVGLSRGGAVDTVAAV